ncbi:hypothetical protein K438DRAFT_2030591 [Mycena galopus ATCC 62051]|nr:hypothetical protein K438DRAFT_2030591 [Mycena galopus ATCC 62051]
MQESLFALLLVGIVRAALQNITVDDASPDIVYGGQIFQCAADTCPPILTEGLFNKSATVTSGSISLNFTGTAFYATIATVGAAGYSLDGANVENWMISPDGPDIEPGDGTFNISQVNLTNQLHTIVVGPSFNDSSTIIGFDRLIYTVVVPDGKKSHVGAIVGGVIGGVAVIFVALFAAMIARRRKLIVRRNQRKSAVLRSLTAARPYGTTDLNDGGNSPASKSL